MKYLETATNLTNNYAVPAYTKQSLDLARWSIESMFGKQTEKQQALGKFF